MCDVRHGHDYQVDAEVEMAGEVQGGYDGATERRQYPPPTLNGTKRLLAVVALAISAVGIAIGVIASPFITNVRGVAALEEKTDALQRSVDLILEWEARESHQLTMLESLTTATDQTAIRNEQLLKEMDKRVHYLEQEAAKGGRYTSQEQMVQARKVGERFVRVQTQIEAINGMFEKVMTRIDRVEGQ